MAKFAIKHAPFHTRIHDAPADRAVRDAYGAALMPALGAGLSAAVWVALTWLGMPWDGGWIWVISLVAPLLVAVGLALWLPRHRAAVDEARFTELVAPWCRWRAIRGLDENQDARCPIERR